MTSVHRLVAVSLFVAASSVSLFGAQDARLLQDVSDGRRPTHDFSADWRAVRTSHNAWFAWHSARLEVALPVRPSR